METELYLGFLARCLNTITKQAKRMRIHLIYDSLSINETSKKNEESIIVDFLIPTFANILQQMIEKDDNDNLFNTNNKEKEWYKVISHRYEKELNRDPTAGEIPPLTAAQLLLKVGPQKQNAAYKELSFVVKARERGMKDD